MREFSHHLHFPIRICVLVICVLIFSLDWITLRVGVRGSTIDHDRIDIESVNVAATTSKSRHSMKQQQNNGIQGYNRRDTAPLLNHRELQQQQQQLQSSSNKKYFLSIITMVRDEVNTILEFMQHYIEEGVDHVYLYDDGSTDGTVEALRGCVPEQYYTVFTRENLTFENYDWFKGHFKQVPDQFHVLHELYNVLGARDESEWVMVIDVDELMVSRVYPQLTVREVLSQEMSGCDIVSVPWLIFTWGDHKRTVPNTARYRLFDRWSFDDKFAIGREGGKFSNINIEIPVKAIVRTEKVPYMSENHYADFRQSLEDTMSETTGVVCLSHIAEHMACNVLCKNHANETAFVEPHRFHHANSFPEKILRELGRQHIKSCSELRHEMPFCVPHNKLVAYNSPRAVQMTEADVDMLQLGIHHYRSISYDDYRRKTDKSRSFSNHYRDQDSIKEVNRRDVVDTFMVRQRMLVRRNRGDYNRIAAIFKNCPAEMLPPVDTNAALKEAFDAEMGKLGV